ncbi:MAG TPA: DOMON-like domain-containing protein [Sphingomonas sp.]|uniref:DOMON-like domain-containing protein n=1 Tax=Sphingomonas sp. TaxID=28214 RepID=UPI002C3B7ADE|nr:DOMON-like domain-containing protein [Sphingomonas sp.]HMI20877.1 DOMON-like domain-containing protein [Sphingomonas sp.]
MFLRPHPDSPSPVTRIEVEMLREAPDLLTLIYSIFGDLEGVSFPPAQASARTDDLWKHTCFEVFLGAEQGYCEYNFSPSSQWAAYRFDGHRAGMRDAPTADPSIEWRTDDGGGVLSVTLRLPPDVTGWLGLSAIIEDTNGNRSFWALAHPAGAPDFHHAACFAAELPPAG